MNRSLDNKRLKYILSLGTCNGSALRAPRTQTAQSLTKMFAATEVL